MALSPEERKRIYEEEKARLEAQERAKRELKSEKIKKQLKGCFWLFGLLIVLFVLLILTSLNDTNKPDSVEGISEPSEPLEYQLAVINEGGYVAKDDITVTRFRHLLETLDQKCFNSKQQIADIVVKAQEILRNNYGIEIKLLDLMEGVNKSIPYDTSNADFAKEVAWYMQSLKY